MEFSLFGEKFTRHAGITQLMDDLNQGLLNPDAIMLGGGNPAPIPAMLERFQTEAKQLLETRRVLEMATVAAVMTSASPAEMERLEPLTLEEEAI